MSEAGKRIRQDNLADQIGVSKNTLWRDERGEGSPTLQTVEKFAELSGFSISEPLRDDGDGDERKTKFLDDIWDAHLKHFGIDDR